MPKEPPKPAKGASPPRTQIIVSDCLPVLKKLKANSLDALCTDPPAAISFMQNGWDDDRGGRDPWIAWLTEILTECWRVLKPGAHALIWALPRTSGWTHRAIENAGFEIRDSIAVIFGQGMPKSLDVSKAIDKKLGAKRKVIGKRTLQGTAALSIKEKGGTFKSGGEPTVKRSVEVDVTTAASPEAQQWNGWHTALKPSHEMWILARKPLEGTVANNVLKHGTGALNIDATRVGKGSDKTPAPKKRGNSKPAFTSTKHMGGNDQVGRFPANTIISERVAAELADKGSYFYCAKSSRADRNLGLPEGEQNPHNTVKPQALMSYLVRLITPPKGIVLDPFAGSGSTGVACLLEGFSFLGIEQDPAYAKTALARLSGAAKGNSRGDATKPKTTKKGTP